MDLNFPINQKKTNDLNLVKSHYCVNDLVCEIRNRNDTYGFNAMDLSVLLDVPLRSCYRLLSPSESFKNHFNLKKGFWLAIIFGKNYFDAISILITAGINLDFSEKRGEQVELKIFILNCLNKIFDGELKQDDETTEPYFEKMLQRVTDVNQYIAEHYQDDLKNKQI